MKNLWPWVHVIEQILDAKWPTYLAKYTHLLVGFSGGLDSTVLLHVLQSYSFLHNKITAVHINHGISPNASNWQNHCQQFCKHLAVDFIAQAVHVDISANIEARARHARYEIFTSLLTATSCLVLAHHSDDQAETLLLRLCRGAGIDGLAAMADISALGRATLARPLLSVSRCMLEQYALLHQLIWIEDESNEEIYYARNYIRHKIMPLLAQKWPGVVANMTRAATHCQQAQANLEHLAFVDHAELAESLPTLSIKPLFTLSFARIINVIKVWLKKNQVLSPSTATLERLINELILARCDARPVVGWGSIRVYRYQDTLYLEYKNHAIDKVAIGLAWNNFPSPINLTVSSINMLLLAEQAQQGVVVADQDKVVIKFRQGGERIQWRGQHKQLKKLFQVWKVLPWQRDQIPLIYINNKLAAVVGYAISDLFYSDKASKTWQLKTKIDD